MRFFIHKTEKFYKYILEANDNYRLHADNVFCFKS